jgi:hypothetical protein
MPAPTSAEDKQKLLSIADNFDQLIAQTKIIEAKLADYLKD